MVLDEFVTAVLGFAVGCATTAALYIGLLGMMGAAHVVRCSACSHWMLSWADSVPICTRCDRPQLRHPMMALRRRRGPRAEALTGLYGPLGSSVSRSEAGLLRASETKG